MRTNGRPPILIVHASGTNRDGEAARACELAGGAPEIVHINQLRQGYRRFEPNPPQPSHHHLICLRCGRVEEFQHERLERMLPIIADEHGFKAERHRLELYGTCRECQRRAFG